MKKQTQPNTILIIRAENAKGILTRVLGILDRPNFYVASMTMSKTDIMEQVVIILEAVIPESAINNLLFRLEKIIEVESAMAQLTANIDLLKAGVFEIDVDKADPGFWQVIQKYGATVIFNGQRLLVEKTAQANDLLDLYNLLDQGYLKTYQETLLTTAKWINENGRVLPVPQIEMENKQTQFGSKTD